MSYKAHSCKSFRGLNKNILIKQRCRRRHGTRPDWSCYGIRDAWKFHATPTVQSAPEQRALDRLAVSKHDTRLLLRFLTSCDLDFWPFIWKLSLYLLVPWETYIPILIFYIFFCFRVRSPYGTDWRTDGQTDRQTEGRARCVMLLMGRPGMLIRPAKCEPRPRPRPDIPQGRGEGEAEAKKMRDRGRTL